MLLQFSNYGQSQDGKLMQLMWLLGSLNLMVDSIVMLRSQRVVYEVIKKLDETREFEWSKNGADEGYVQKMKVGRIQTHRFAQGIMVNDVTW